MSHRAGTHPTGYLIVDWNGTVVDDIDRALVATEAAVTAVNGFAGFDSTQDFQRRFRLPLSQFFTDLGVAESLIYDAVILWNKEMAIRSTAIAPGARSLLVRAHELNIAVHVVSGATKEAVRADAARLHVESLIDTIAGEVHPKRDAITSLRRTHAPAMYIGDTEYDIGEARATGAIAVGTTYGYAQAHRLRNAGAHLLVNDLARLIPVLEAMDSQFPSDVRSRTQHE